MNDISVTNRNNEFIINQPRENVMMNLIQYLTISSIYDTLKQVQGNKLRLFTRPS